MLRQINATHLGKKDGCGPASDTAGASGGQLEELGPSGLLGRVPQEVSASAVSAAPLALPSDTLLPVVHPPLRWWLYPPRQTQRPGCPKSVQPESDPRDAISQSHVQSCAQTGVPKAHARLPRRMTSSSPLAWPTYWDVPQVWARRPARPRLRSERASVSRPTRRPGRADARAGPPGARGRCQ